MNLPGYSLYALGFLAHAIARGSVYPAHMNHENHIFPETKAIIIVSTDNLI